MLSIAGCLYTRSTGGGGYNSVIISPNSQRVVWKGFCAFLVIIALRSFTWLWYRGMSLSHTTYPSLSKLYRETVPRFETKIEEQCRCLLCLDFSLRLVAGLEPDAMSSPRTDTFQTRCWRLYAPLGPPPRVPCYLRGRTTLSPSKYYLRIQSVPQREHHTSPLQRSTG
jgi:hypothetical protein